MKKIIMSLLALFCFIGLNAQVNINKFKEVFPLTYQKISYHAKQDWPSDFEMQKYVIEIQCQSFVDFSDICQNNKLPEDVFNQIVGQSMLDWTHNSNPSENCKGLKGDEFFACWDVNWEMVVFTIRNQIEAYNKIK